MGKTWGGTHAPGAPLVPTPMISNRTVPVVHLVANIHSQKKIVLPLNKAWKFKMKVIHVCYYFYFRLSLPSDELPSMSESIPLSRLLH